MLITLFTPTYNRAHLLERLYSSIKKQTYHHFEWLIVDDGSTDNTSEVVKTFIEEGIITIKYVFKRNGVTKCVITPELEENLAIQQLWKSFDPIIFARRATFRLTIDK